MNKTQLSKIMGKANDICLHSGVRLTEKRKRILEILVQSQASLSAYEIASLYNKHADTAMPVMSVYRILDFLESEQLVHKLNSANKYVACSHIACDHAHEVAQFLICNQCQRVKEISINKSIIRSLQQNVEKAGFHLVTPQLEMDCMCDHCLANAA